MPPAALCLTLAWCRLRRLLTANMTTPASSTPLVPVSLIDPRFRRLFPYATFNAMQSQCFDVAYGSDRSMVVSAPTGSGKTVVLEMALARLWSGCADHATRPTAIYIAPLKALTHERFLDWTAKLSGLGIKCVELTGDTDDDPEVGERAVRDADLIVTTPEKWDAFSRWRRDARGVIGRVGLLLLDEIHLLNDPERGPTLESAVARMLALSKSAEVRGAPIASLRTVSLSATISNHDDVARWLGGGGGGAGDADGAGGGAGGGASGAAGPCLALHFDESFRPVRLEWQVLSFPMTNVFHFDSTLVGRLPEVVRAHCAGRPALVFCNSRKTTVSAAAQLVRHAAASMSGGGMGGGGWGAAQLQPVLLEAAARARDAKLRELLPRGVGFHTAGLDAADRTLVEALFQRGALPVLCSTSGLAQVRATGGQPHIEQPRTVRHEPFLPSGPRSTTHTPCPAATPLRESRARASLQGVNLPAHLVVVLNTAKYASQRQRYEEYSVIEVLQMAGRAGRPQFDSSGKCIVMTRADAAPRYLRLASGSEAIESHMIAHRRLRRTPTPHHLPRDLPRRARPRGARRTCRV